MAKIFVSSVIEASIDEVWARIRDFNALADWHPAIADSTIENGEPSDKVGCIRNFNLIDGGNIRERLLTLSDAEHLCTYSILKSPMAVEDYVATLRLLPITDGNRNLCPVDGGIQLSVRGGRGVGESDRRRRVSGRI